MIEANHGDIIIRAEKARPSFNNDQRLPPLTCHIIRGKMVCLMGLQNSILVKYMKILAGIKPPGAGEIQVSGDNSSFCSPQEKVDLRLKFGFVLHGGPLLSVLNGIENLKLAARYHQLGSEIEIREKAEKFYSEWPFEANHRLLPAYMSKIHQRCLAIARPLMLDPQVVFIDSPFEGLDHQDRFIVADYLSNIVKHKHITVIVCNVGIYFANQHADQILFCDNQETLVFDNWRSFYECQQKNIELLFKHEHIKKNERK